MSFPNNFPELSFAQTTADLADFSLYLDMLSRRLYQTNQSLDVGQVRGKAAMAFQAMFENAVDKEALIQSFRDAIKNVQVMQLTVAVVPTSHMIDAWWQWVRTEVGEGIVLDIVVDQDVFGGAQITYEGRYVDATIARALHEHFEYIQTIDAI